MFLSDTYERRVNDKVIAEATPYSLSDDSAFVDDVGFLGYRLPDVQHIRPFKKPKGGQLTPEQKAHNRYVAHLRIVVEHRHCKRQALPYCQRHHPPLERWRS
jgi:hypothetical protein